jgi:hypothetical protein
MLCDSFGSFAQLNCRPCRKQCGWQSVPGRTVFLFLLGTLNFSAIALLCCAPDSGTNRRNASFSVKSKGDEPGHEKLSAQVYNCCCDD